MSESYKKGTPKTLIEAVSNGLDEQGLQGASQVRAQLISRHIKDFLSQHMQVAMNVESAQEKDAALDRLWAAVSKNQEIL